MAKQKAEKLYSGEVPLKSAQKLADVLLNNKTLVHLGDGTFELKPLRKWSQWRILETYLKIKETEKDVNSIIAYGATNLRYSAEIIAILLLNHEFDIDKDNEAMISQMTNKVLFDTTDSNQWASIIVQSINSLDIEQLFSITALTGAITQSLMMRKEKVEQQSQELRQLNLEMK